jgi:outer membrane protein OmpA-like peptidoglycan-associated protein
MPEDAKSDRNLISQEKHELDYLLNKWNKAVNNSNREILSGLVKEFKAATDWAPHNRERFYEYMGTGSAKDLLANKEADKAQITVVEESDKEKSPYTVIKDRAAAPKPKKKGVLVPLLLVVLGIIAVGVLVYFLAFYKPQAQTELAGSVPADKETPVGGEASAAEETPAAAGEEETSSSLLEQFKQTVAGNSPLLFVGDQAVLLPGEDKKLEKILKGIEGLRKIDLTLSGHTANVGFPAGELALSEKRALVIKNYLLENSKGAELKITTSGKGATEPIVKDVPVSEQQPNRRVEIAVNNAE